MSDRCCVMCGSPLPASHRYSICSMCYGDIDHGTDGYYRQEMERTDEQTEDDDDGEPDFTTDEDPVDPQMEGWQP